MYICKEELCSGCATCFNVCHANAIKMVPDEEGFLRPKIDLDSCVNCGLCSRTCPANQTGKKYMPNETVYACWSQNSQIRNSSSSGGLFSALADAILDANGVVYGAAQINKIVQHIRVTQKDDLLKLRGSKYVQSEIGNCYKNVEVDLRQDKKVLFSGTACQIDGLKHFLGKEYDNLYTCDVICHGVPSPKFLEDYISVLENQYKSSIKSMAFRDKTTGWFDYSMKVDFINGKVYRAVKHKDPYLLAFLTESIIRPSCHTCAYTGLGRVSDLTIADFWGYKDSCQKDMDDNKGISLCMLNTKKGEELFTNAQSSLLVFERPLQQAVNGNRCLRESYPPSPMRKEFWNLYLKSGYNAVKERYLSPKLSLKETILYSPIGAVYKRVKYLLRKKRMK